MLIKLNNFKGKKVVITGHTGFKGSWLSLWLHSLNAKILGISNSNREKFSNFSLFNLKDKIIDKNIDLRKFNKLKKVIKRFEPDYIFHLAAQAIVKKSFEDPKKTWESNTMATINLLESLKVLKKQCVVVMITSDKVYKNLEIERGYKENDLLGGHDPYSASKASADIAIKSYSESFFNNSNIKIVIARAGNVIGGGDWSEGRLIPDCMKSCLKNKKVFIRSPNSTRPWQHVLDVLYGYLTLALKLKNNSSISGNAFNFGPSGYNFRVLKVVKLMKKEWNKLDYKILKIKNFKESKLLKLNSSKSKKILKWKCFLNIRTSVLFTVKWYKSFSNNKYNVENLSINQIKEFQKKLY